MNRRRKIYEGKAKDLYEGPEPGTLVQYFKDDATAGNGKKHEIIDGKGVLNNRISEFIFSKLNMLGIPTHFLRRINMREQLIKEVEIIPLEVVVRNVAAGSLVKRQMTRRSSGGSGAAESSVSSRNWPRSRRSTRNGPLPTRRATLVSAAHDASGSGSHTCLGRTRT